MNVLLDVFHQVAAKVDGAALVRAGHTHLVESPTHVLAVGKVAFPMLEGLLSLPQAKGLRGGLVVAPATRFRADVHLPAGMTALVADHPDPSDRSVLAGRAACAFVEALAPTDRLLVLLSGGGSSSLVVPAAGLTLEEKRITCRMLARAGASIHELNAVRKHLSAIKGGRLALRSVAAITVFALSDVVGSDPGTIASGPFSPDATTFAEAAALISRLAPLAPEAALAHLQRGVAGDLPETPKPGDPRLRHVTYTVLAGPERVAAEARSAAKALSLVPAVLSSNVESPVPELAVAYATRAKHEVRTGGHARVLIGNGEPSIVVSGSGRGGRATHLALSVARGLAGVRDVAFLAAGTDDRDGSADASGAVVDGSTWERAQACGLDPEGALLRCDSEPLLRALGCLVHGPGTSNLLDLHLLYIGPRAPTTDPG